MHNVVIGAGFGDEGKGLVTNALATSGDYDVVVRYGGPQAGHTVVHENTRHVFAQFGAGTLAGLPTHLSQFMVVHPEALLNERAVLVGKGFKPKITIDPRALIILPRDVSNTTGSQERRDHGTTGMGVFCALDRTYKSHIPTVTVGNAYDIFFEGTGIELVRTEDVVRNNRCLFESSQGLLLDKDSGFFPHVTPLSIGLQHPAIMTCCDPRELQVTYVTRSFLTRHGNGPMYKEGVVSTMDPDLAEHLQGLDKTNVYNQYQGPLRVGSLDVMQMRYHIRKDLINARMIRDIRNPDIVVTWADTMPQIIPVIRAMAYDLQARVGLSRTECSIGAFEHIVM